MMRPAASQAARPEPIAIATENTARQTVTTGSVAAERVLTIPRQQRERNRTDQPEPVR